MITFPKAKINLGLNIVARRPDGYHDLETVFYPVPLCDALELCPMSDDFPSAVSCDLKVTGITINGDEQNNLVVRAYNMLKAEHPHIGRLHAHLHKAIPTQAGMGGGSSDCASMLMLVAKMFHLYADECQGGRVGGHLMGMAARLGADCPFFIYGKPAYAEGIGERLTPIDLDLSGWHLAVVCPPIPVSTREAFSLVEPRRPSRCCRDIVTMPVEAWRGVLDNDFEKSVFALHPEIGAVKQALYDLGAAYSAMSGSGSSVFGLFRQKPDLRQLFQGMYAEVVTL